jgi:hypothetical protein
MKNIHILPTDKPSRLAYCTVYKHQLSIPNTLFEVSQWTKPFNICITNDEEIKVGDWYLDTFNTQRIKANEFSDHKHYGSACKKIILTDNKDLIKDGVQAIDDEFLEWFVKNPSCEKVLVTNLYGDFNPIEYFYEIIIPKEEPKSKLTNQKYLDKMKTDGVTEEFLKQETLEEVANKAYPFYGDVELREAIELGAKWQQEQDKNKYSEEDLISFYNFIENHQLRKYGDVWKRITNDSKDKPLNFQSVDDQYIIEWFEKFKNK